ncbi:MAG: MarC family protein [Vicinamibacteria bacterium]
MLQSFLTLLVVVDPIGVAVLFLGLAGSRSRDERRSIARKAVLVAALVLFVFALFGSAVLTHLGITLSAFRVAGGFLLFKIATDMVFAQHERETKEEEAEARERPDISVFPLAIPLLAGPGALAAVMILAGAGDPGARAAAYASIALVSLMAYLSLLVADRLFRLLGHTGVNVVTRILGVLLAALSVQYIADGAKGLWS